MNKKKKEAKKRIVFRCGYCTCAAERSSAHQNWREKHLSYRSPSVVVSYGLHIYIHTELCFS